MAKVLDPSLAEQGRLKIEWAESRMPVLMELKKHYSQTKPLKGFRIAGCLHITKETAVLVRTLQAAGAQASWCGCNPLSTQDDVAAALAAEGIDVYGWRGLSNEEYYWCVEESLKIKPHLTIDDGADLVFVVHNKHPELLKDIIGGCEETTTGINRIRAMADSKMLKYPVVAVSDAETKWDFDNVFGTGESTLDGIKRATNVMYAGKTVVVAGYGHCGKGVASRVRGNGANVVLTEVNPIAALRARMEGFKVMTMDDAAKVGDIFITVTGCSDVITEKHFSTMKNGAILANSGHFNVEIDAAALDKISMSKKQMRDNNIEYTLHNGNKIYLLAEGRLVNLSAAEGHPSEVMDMSFANQFLSLLWLAKNKGIKPDVYPVPKGQDAEVASLKLSTMGITIDKLTPAQEKYLSGFEAGT
ncbi:MAG: adenosylhomocysteinase [archaeon]